MKQQALKLLELLHKKKQAYQEVNNSIINLMGDFPSYIQCCDAEVEAKLVGLLDNILEDEIASYFLYECDNYHGLIIEHDIEYPIRNFEDVVKFVERKK